MKGTRLVVKPGMVIDLENADVTENKNGDRNLRVVLRTPSMIGFCTLFAGEYAIGWKNAKIVSIDYVTVSYTPGNQYRYGRNTYFNVYATLENAETELPDLHATNKPMVMPKKKSDGVEWVRPDFQTGDVDATEEES